MATASASQTLAQNQWYHLLGTYSASQSAITIYVDGVQKGQTTASVPLSLQNSTANLNVGREAGAVTPNYLNGSLDEVKLYNYPLSADEVKLDECSGATAYDSSGKNNHGTINPTSSGNTTTGTCNSGTSTEMWNDGTNGKFNASLGFDGTDDYVQIADTFNLRFDNSTQDFSLFAWVKRTTTGTEYIISKEDADNDGWRIQFNSSNQVLCSEDATDVTSTSTITDTNWHLIGCTIDRDGNGQVYIDGVANGSTVAMGTDAMATTANIRIGTRSYTSTSYFNGLIDEVRIYSYALTPTQVRTVYNENSAIRFGPLTGSP